MKKAELERKTNTALAETRDALQTVYNALNQGQQKKILKEKEVAELFARYGVEVDE